MIPQVPFTAGGSGYVSRLGRIDVRDLERLPDLVAADFLTHELIEQQLKLGINPHDQLEVLAIHGMATDGERAIMGAARLQPQERVTPGIDPRRPIGRGEHWQWWIPYQHSSGAIRAVMMRMQGHNVESSRLMGFSSLNQFAQTAQTAGLVLWPN
jgi:hypothetical protein